MSSESAFASVAFPLAFNKYKYLDLTNQLNNYNEIYNMNKHVADMNKSEISKAASFDESLKTKVLKLKQEYLLKEFSNNNYKFWTNVIYFTIVVICITLSIIAFYSLNSDAPTPTLSKGLTTSIIIGIAVIYLIIILVAIGSKIIRRKYAWNQFYWRNETKK